MIDRFEELVRELGVEYTLFLHPDHRGACKLCINGVMHVQIEFRQEQNALIMATFICELPPGKFRENILKAALKTNHLFPEQARLCYCEKNNELALFQSISMTQLNGKKLSELLERFIKKAEEWRLSIETGTINNLITPIRTEGKGLFGLIP